MSLDLRFKTEEKKNLLAWLVMRINHNVTRLANQEATLPVPRVENAHQNPRSAFFFFLSFFVRKLSAKGNRKHRNVNMRQLKHAVTELSVCLSVSLCRSVSVSVFM